MCGCSNFLSTTTWGFGISNTRSIFSSYGMPFNLLFKLTLLLIVNSCSATASELEYLVVC
jgi:hypothetical protein